MQHIILLMICVITTFMSIMTLWYQSKTFYYPITTIVLSWILVVLLIICSALPFLSCFFSFFHLKNTMFLFILAFPICSFELMLVEKIINETVNIIFLSFAIFILVSLMILVNLLIVL